MRPIVRVPNPVLSQPAKTVTAFDKKFARLVSEMKKTLLATKNPKGVGLAAPQIGESWRVFMIKPTAKAPIGVFVNAEVTKRSQAQTDGIPERENKLEGCLSIPRIWGQVRRASEISLKYQDEKGKTHEEGFSGFLATIIQHEVDHTNGVVFTQRVLEQKGKLYEPKKDDEGKEVLEEITLTY
jgi:peptide deformylase